jgi:methylenetetrahydrofolate dehydrogenase (NADP+)/methenyltetrahydrofolate cyclohydrolase
MIIDGKEISNEINEQTKRQVEELMERTGKQPYLFVISFKGDAEIYVRNIAKHCDELGIIGKAKIFQEPNEEQIISLIEELNADEKINGILVHRPIPIPEDNILSFIAKEKDVYGIHSSYSYDLIGSEVLSPVVPIAVLNILENLNTDLEGKHVVIVNRSKFIGRPLAQMFLQKNATVTICHSKTQDLGKYTSQADILITAAGNPGLITADMVKENSIVIDVAMTMVDGHWKGDVDFENVKDKVYAITPVPGGVGPVTVSAILRNTLKAFKNQLNL